MRGCAFSGDSEVDVAMTEVFGGFGADFYKGEQEEHVHAQNIYLVERLSVSVGSHGSIFFLSPCIHHDQQGYESEWPLPPGFEKRKVVYNLYHILNHYVLFGGGYRGQARSMIEEILRF